MVNKCVTPRKNYPARGAKIRDMSFERGGAEPIDLPLNRMPSDRTPDEDGGESFDWGPMNVDDSEMGDTQITDWAIEQLRKGFDGQPFFLGVGYYRPHIPLWAPLVTSSHFRSTPFNCLPTPRMTWMT